MKRKFLTARGNTLLSLVLGLLTAVFVFVVLIGWEIPFVSGEKENFIALAVFGAVLCVAGNAHSAILFGWKNPLYWGSAYSLIGIGLGVATALLTASTLFGMNISLGIGYKAAFVGLAVIIFLKVGLKILQNWKLKITG